MKTPSRLQAALLTAFAGAALILGPSAAFAGDHRGDRNDRRGKKHETYRGDRAHSPRHHGKKHHRRGKISGKEIGILFGLLTLREIINPRGHHPPRHHRRHRARVCYEDTGRHQHDHRGRTIYNRGLTVPILREVPCHRSRRHGHGHHH